MNMKWIKRSLWLFILIISITGCGRKNALTADKFKNKMEDKKYIIENTISNLEEYTYLVNAYTAVSQESLCAVEFYEMKDVDHAIYFFDNNKTKLEAIEDDTKKDSSRNYGNYNQYTLKTSNDYYYISRVDKTVIYINDDISCQSELKSIIKYLGY